MAPFPLTMRQDDFAQCPSNKLRVNALDSIPDSCYSKILEKAISYLLDSIRADNTRLKDTNFTKDDS
jgi:hypothetical protein